MSPNRLRPSDVEARVPRVNGGSMQTSEESGSASSGSQAAGDDVKYMFTTVKAIRGRESATKAKWQDQGWEFVSQTQGTLRSELTFRKVEPKGIGAYLVQGYAAFRRLEPKTQKIMLGGVSGLIVLLVIGGLVAAAVSGGDETPEETKPAAVESKKTPETSSREPSSEPSEEAMEQPVEPETAAAEPETAAAEPYSYSGPKYEVVVADKTLGPGKPTQYWLYAPSKFNLSTDAYKAQVKLMIADVAHEQGTANFIAEIVTNREIALAEALSTSEDFVAEHGFDFAINTVPQLEVKGWVANYTGGIDPVSGEPSEDPSAYEIIWRPYANSELETWKPEVVRSAEPAAEETEPATPKAKPKPAALEERTAIDFLANAWEAKFTYGGDVNDLMGLLDVVRNSDGSYYIEVTATVENDLGNEFEAVVEGTVAGTDARPRIVRSTITTPGSGPIGYYE
jgi:hypothetical protein